MHKLEHLVAKKSIANTVYLGMDRDLLLAQ